MVHHLQSRWWVHANSALGLDHDVILVITDKANGFIYYIIGWKTKSFPYQSICSDVQTVRGLAVTTLVAVVVVVLLVTCRRSGEKAFSSCFKNIHSDCSYKCTPRTVNVFWKGYNAAWPFRGEPSSDHAVPTAAMCSVMEAEIVG